MTIDLIADSTWQGEWKWGRVFRSDFSIPTLQKVVSTILKQSTSGYIYFYKGDRLLEGIKEIIKLTEYPNRVYTGNTVVFPVLLSYSVPLSFYNFEPFDNTKEYSTWLVSLENCLVDKALLQANFLDARFKSLAGAGAWWAFQQLFAGAIIRYSPLLKSQQPMQPIPVHDQFRIVKYLMGFKWGIWTCFRLLLTGSILSGLWGIRTLIRLRSQHPVFATSINHNGWRQAPLPANPHVSVLIPTVDRYIYLFKLLEQLKGQTIKPLEILIIDQTIASSRKPITISDLPLRVFTLEESGQCRSRNLGLQYARGEYILFLDDDDEVYPELIEDHLRNLSFFNADVSCGLCREPGQRETPKNFSMIRVADIFSTNNGMVKRSVLEQIGFFDMVYDRGQKADGDLGARMFRAGALMMMNPEIKVIHHRAPCGGLRKHNVRKITYASSRSNITHFRLPHVTELYFNLKNLTTLQQREYLWHSILGTFSIRGCIFRKLIKAAWALLCLPKNLIELRYRLKEAKRIYSRVIHSGSVNRSA
jgi:glycosyltransferase involved in cell wall biosynthesis